MVEVETPGKKSRKFDAFSNPNQFNSFASFCLDTNFPTKKEVINPEADTSTIKGAISPPKTISNPKPISDAGTNGNPEVMK